MGIAHQVQTGERAFPPVLDAGESEVAMATQTKNNKPDFIVRAPDPNSPGKWLSLGAAWQRRNGEAGFNVKLNTVPVGNQWDGTLILLPPLEPEGPTDK
jgi:hypothetical protein